jgi:hypothetical protein
MVKAVCLNNIFCNTPEKLFRTLYRLPLQVSPEIALFENSHRILGQFGHPHLLPPPQNICNREQDNTIFCGVKGNFRTASTQYDSGLPRPNCPSFCPQKRGIRAFSLRQKERFL